MEALRLPNSSLVFFRAISPFSNTNMLTKDDGMYKFPTVFYKFRLTFMANHKSAEKRVRQTKTKTARNKSHLSMLRTAVKKVEQAIVASDKSTAQTSFKAVEPILVKSAKKGLIHGNTVARKISRLSQKIKAL